MGTPLVVYVGRGAKQSAKHLMARTSDAHSMLKHASAVVAAAALVLKACKHERELG